VVEKRSEDIEERGFHRDVSFHSFLLLRLFDFEIIRYFDWLVKEKNRLGTTSAGLEGRERAFFTDQSML